eukprot:6320189-Pyramimonas_sp.AAC.1
MLSGAVFKRLTRVSSRLYGAPKGIQRGFERGSTEGFTESLRWLYTWNGGLERIWRGAGGAGEIYKGPMVVLDGIRVDVVRYISEHWPYWNLHPERHMWFFPHDQGACLKENSHKVRTMSHP